MDDLQKQSVDKQHLEAADFVELLSQSQTMLAEARAQVEALELKYAMQSEYIHRLDQEISRLTARVQEAAARSEDIASETRAQDLEMENERLRNRLSDVEDYLKVTRGENSPFYL